MGCHGTVMFFTAINSFLTDDDTEAFVDSVDQDYPVQNMQSDLPCPHFHSRL